MLADKIEETIKTNLKTIADHFGEEDRAVRERQIRLYRKLKYYWNGFTRIWYSETAHDWRVWGNLSDDSDGDDSYYDKPVNIFKAYLESIIAALSISTPGIRCAPDDADNPLDISTAKAGNKIAELIAKHNNVTFLWLHALYIYCTEGMVACYSYSKEDDSYGTYEEKEYKDDVEERYICPSCGEQISDTLFTQAEQDEFMPDDGDIEINNLIENEGMITCPECSEMIDPDLEKSKLVVTKLTGITHKPKTRQCMEVYGGLYVKVPNYAMKQEDIPYLIFSYETHYANALDRFPFLRDKIMKGGSTYAASGIGDPYERWGRLSTQYYGEYPINNVTIRNIWLRPASYNILSSDTDVAELKKQFPNGCKIVFVDDCIASAENESLDDCWTLTHNPLSDYLQHDPLGLLLVSVQDITNDLISLVIQTIEQGIPQTFVDPAVVNQDEYNQQENTPGALYSTKPQGANKNISESFFTFKAATLSEEVLPFSDRIQQMGQLVSGALPSLFGGQSEAGSKTASEYAMSRSQALQRLQTPWKMLSIWWKEIFSKVVPAYIKDMAEDERLVEKDKQGNYVNVFVRKAEVQGKIGDIELESSEQLPTTWAQIKDVIMKLMELNNPQLLEALFSPENLPWIGEALGLTSFKLPGEDDRQKQYEEIQQLLMSEPIPVEPDPSLLLSAQAGDQNAIMALQNQPTEQPSVPIDSELDNNEVEADICRRFLISEPGRLAKIQNPPGYLNVLLHYKAHREAIEEQMMQQQMQQMQMQQQVPPAAGKKDGNQMPTKNIAAQTGDNDGVRTPIQ